MADDVRPLKEPESIGRALTPDQKTALLETAALKPEWQTAYYAAQIALQTGMRGCEIRSLQWSDVDLLSDTLTIRKSKTAAGVRTIPLTRAAFETFVELQHYVFARFKPVGRFERQELQAMRMIGFDPTQPLGSWKKAWRTLTRKAGLPGLRFHDLRHHLITELCESGASEQTIKSIAGHVSLRMLDRYSHIRLDAKRQALEALAQGSHGTNYDTKSDHSQPLSSQTTDSNGRRVRI